MDNSKKLKMYEKFGALWFQKVVFKVEDLKFKLIDKFCPNIDEWYSSRCDKKVNELCLKVKTEEERNAIRFEYNCKKMRFKREIIEKKNRNYHMDFNNSSTFYNYLLWNKKVHMNGIVTNVVSLGLAGVLLPLASGFWFGAGCCFIAYNILSLGVNFECVNLQNYNICRFNERRDTLAKLEQRRKDSDARKYALCGEKIYKKLEESVETPKTSEVVSSMSSLEELQQLRALALEIQRQNKSNSSDTEKNKVIMKK